MPWIEDKYLAWFGENKTSYTAKGIIRFTISLPPPLRFSNPILGASLG